MVDAHKIHKLTLVNQEKIFEKSLKLQKKYTLVIKSEEFYFFLCWLAFSPHFARSHIRCDLCV